MAFALLARSQASESDQFMTWGVELEDGSPAFNNFLNTEAEIFLQELNLKKRAATLEGDEVALEYTKHVFAGLLGSRLRKWFRESDEIEDYPPRDKVSVYGYQEMSVYRGRSFPYYLPMSRTIRFGDVYLGTDKVSHIFGFGRRYFKLYKKYLAAGLSDEEAQIKAINWGIRMEQSTVGKLVDGVMSYGDLEANYQGMRMVMDLGGGDNPCFVNENGKWHLARPIDILDYITPDFDESYNTPHYWLLRKRFVLPIYREEICKRYYSEEVQARFAIYREYEQSFFMKVMEEKLNAKKKNEKRNHSLEVICAECCPEEAALADSAGAS